MNDSQLELLLNRKLKRLLLFRTAYLVVIFLAVTLMLFRGWSAAGIVFLAAALVLYLFVSSRAAEDVNESYREALCARTIGRVLKEYRFERRGSADAALLSVLPEGKPENEKQILCRERSSGTWHSFDVQVFDTAYAVKQGGKRVMRTGCAVAVQQSAASGTGRQETAIKREGEAGAKAAFSMQNGNLALRDHDGPAVSEPSEKNPAISRLIEIGAGNPSISAAGDGEKVVFLLTDRVIGGLKINTARKVSAGALHLNPLPELEKLLAASELWLRTAEAALPASPGEEESS